MINTVSRPSFKILNINLSSVDAENNDSSIINPAPVFDIINTIYAGYRQCYSAGQVKDLDEPDSALALEYCASLKTGKYSTTARSWKDALMSYDPTGKEISRMVTKAKFIADHINHISQLEHSALTLSVSNISRACSTQFIRHRMAAYGIQSQRYVSWNKADLGAVTMPPSIARRPEAKAVFEEYLQHMEDCVARLTELGIKNEDIRYIYPEGTNTFQVATMNLHSWIHFIEERSCTKAQWEINRIATDLLHLLRIIFPYIFDNVGPKCYRLRYCPETKSCPIIKKVLNSVAVQNS